jgi:hypothetical protein
VSSGVALSGDRPKKMARFLTAHVLRWVSALKLRIVMSSIMRRRSGLMGVSLIGVFPFEVGVGHPLILETRTPAPSPQSVQPVTTASRRARHPACNPSREAGSFTDPGAEVTLTKDAKRSAWTALVKIGARIVRHGRYVVFQLAEVAVARPVRRDPAAHRRARAKAAAARSMSPGAMNDRNPAGEVCL